MLLQVHDELVLEVAPGEREAVESSWCASAMAGAADLTVPLEVSVGVGPLVARGRALNRRCPVRRAPRPLSAGG